MESDAQLLTQVRTLRRRTEQYLAALTGQSAPAVPRRTPLTQLHQRIARLEAENKILKAELDKARTTALALETVKQALLEGNASVKHLVHGRR